MGKRLRLIRSAALCTVSVLLAFFITISSGIYDRILLADGEKTVITSEMLMQSYEQHYTTEGKMTLIMLAFFGIVMLVLAVSVFLTVNRYRKSQDKNKIVILIGAVMAIPLMGMFGFIFMMSSCGLIFNPAPQKASYRLELKTVIRTEMETSTDSDGDRHYSYSAYIADEKRESGERKISISGTDYEYIQAPGEYYFAYAYSGHTSSQFDIFSADEYEPAPDVEVR